ncbi:MAG: hypothetical protein NC388_03480 [Clostridium sp.]|nr:hypothetical protein [Clostridium sp.]
MPLFFDWKERGFHCAVWHVTESLDELLASLPDSSVYRLECGRRFTSPKRRLEYAAVRVLLHGMTGRPPLVSYEPSGKPFLTDGGAALSISHTKKYVAVALSAQRTVGVDVEQYGNRILSLAGRIVGPQERTDGVWPLLLHWSAKETTYKMMGQEGVDFVRYLRASHVPQDCGPNHRAEGSFPLTSFHPACMAVYRIYYRIFPDFVLTVGLAGDEPE